MKAQATALLLATILLMTSPPVYATLGEHEETVTRDVNALKAVAKAQTDRGTYHVHEIRTESSTIREYAGLDGIVFAIGWNGIAPPDLNQLLGRYAAEYRSANARAPRLPGRRGVKLKTGRIIVEKWGHMRNLQGRAYVPALMPQGVTLDAIR